MELIKKTPSIDFLGWRIPAFIGSGTVLLVMVISLFVQGLNLGIDFTGGTLIEVDYQESADVGEVRDLLAAASIEDAQVQYFGSSSELLIRLPSDHQNTDKATVSNRVMDALHEPYDETVVAATRGKDTQTCVTTDGAEQACRVQMRRVDFVGPTVGNRLAKQAIKAVIYAMIMILIYTAWRFEWRFAVGAVAALAHDALFTIGTFSLLQIEFSLPVVAAVLTVIGYSLNDTIVIFDRVRENFRKMRKGSTEEIMNGALNQTLSRTFLTAFTVLLVLLVLLSVEAIRAFALALLIGVVVGSYSTLFIASPIALGLGVSREDLLISKKEGADQENRP